jgi:hypothetical protein
MCKIADRAKTPRCCKTKTVRVIEAPQVAAYSTLTGWKDVQVNGKHFASGDLAKKYIKDKDLCTQDEGKARSEQAIRNRKQTYKKDLRADLTKAVNKHWQH